MHLQFPDNSYCWVISAKIIIDSRLKATPWTESVSTAGDFVHLNRAYSPEYIIVHVTLCWLPTTLHCTLGTKRHLLTRKVDYIAGTCEMANKIIQTDLLIDLFVQQYCTRLKLKRIVYYFLFQKCCIYNCKCK